MAPTWTERILLRLEQMQLHEVCYPYRDDIAQAWILVNLAARGRPDPYLESHIRVFGCTPAKLEKKLAAYRECLFRPSLPQSPQMELEFEPPKKPPQVAKKVKGVAA